MSHFKIIFSHLYFLVVDFALKKIQRSEDEVIRLQLWDIAGEDLCYGKKKEVYYESAFEIAL